MGIGKKMQFFSCFSNKIYIDKCANFLRATHIGFLQYSPLPPPIKNNNNANSKCSRVVITILYLDYYFEKAIITVGWTFKKSTKHSKGDLFLYVRNLFHVFLMFDNKNIITTQIEF